ncbi:ribonuclease D [soil metagenome]
MDPGRPRHRGGWQPIVTFRWIDDDVALDAVIDRIIVEPRYAMDTEFHRERTYFPRLALVQLGWADEIVLVDPLAVDARRLARLFTSPSLAVLHAAQQDLDVLNHAVGAIPAQIYDTQLAAGFVGYSTPSLLALVQGELGQTPAKGDRLTDWLRRPLTDAQMNYAAADVQYLFELQDGIDAKLAAFGRSGWVAAACEELRTRPVGPIDPDLAWTKLKDARSLRSKARSVAQGIAAWREREARRTDSPVRHVLPDLAILGISQRQPTTVEELGQCRGVDDRHRRGRIAEALVGVVIASLERLSPTFESAGEELDRSLRPAVSLVSAWVSQVAKDARIDTGMLATRNDLVALLRGDADARLRTGWRAELLGDDVTRLVDGRAGLTFDGHGGLRLIDAVAPANA